jgi:glycosyltransferase involved in cell wall biosynthesis
MKASSISVALPVYNGANFLRQALDSVLAQEFSAYELVVSDNCSTDETPRILAEYAERDKRVRVSTASAFLPQADNVNRAVELCSGTWVKLFCHDDLMLPGCLGSIHEAANDPHCDSVGLIGNGEAWLFENGYLYDPQIAGEPTTQIWSGRDLVRRKLRGNATPNLPALTTATVRREAWRSSSKFDNRFVHFDSFFWMRLLMDWDFLSVSSTLTVNRIHGGQVAVSARKSLRSVQDHRIFIREYGNLFADQLGLSRAARLKMRLKPLSVAGSHLAIEIAKGNMRRSLELMGELPVSWWPLLPFFVARSLRRESARTRPILPHVPMEMIYP